MELVIGDRIIRGEIREKKQAQREYNEARRSGKAGQNEQGKARYRQSDRNSIGCGQNGIKACRKKAYSPQSYNTGKRNNTHTSGIAPGARGGRSQQACCCWCWPAHSCGGSLFR